MSTPTSRSEQEIGADMLIGPDRSDFRAACDRLLADVPALLAERDALRAAIQAVEKVCDEQAAYCSDERLDVPSWVSTVRAALAAAGVDREEPQQCDAESGYLGYRCDLPAGHDGRHRTHTETWWGDGDAHLVVELGQRIANDDGLRFSLDDVAAEFGVDREDTEQPQLDEVYVADLKAAVSIAATPWTDEPDTGQADEPQRQRVLSGLAAHREAQRLGRPARTTPVDDALASGGSFQRAGQVVPQQPEHVPDLLPCTMNMGRCIRRSHYGPGRVPGPVGQDTTGGDE